MKKAVLFFSVFIGLFCLADFSSAYVLKYDTFDGYATGSLYGLPMWDVSPTSTWEISDNFASSSPNSLRMGDIDIYDIRPFFNNLPTSTYGQLSFDMYISGQNTTSSIRDFLITTGELPSDFTAVYGNCLYAWTGADNCYVQMIYGASGGDQFTVPVNTWLHFVWEVNYLTQTQKLTYNNGVQSDQVATDPDGHYINEITFGGNTYNSNDYYFDNIEYVGISSSTQNITPSIDEGINMVSYYPYDCQFNLVSTNASGTIDFQASGLIYNTASPPEYNSGINVTELIIELYDANNDVVASTSIDTNGNLNAMHGGSSFQYDYNFYGIPAGQYRIMYTLKGYYVSTYEYWEEVQKTAGCTGCSGVGSSIPTGRWCDWGEIGYLACQNFVDNCMGTSTSWTDQIYCNFEGFFVGLICPNPAVFARTKGMFAEIKAQFPYNYISAGRDFFTSIRADVTTTGATSVISTTDFSPPNRDEFASSGLFNTIYILAEFLILLSCLFMLVGMAREVFK